MADPEAMSWLKESWVYIFGIPDRLLKEPLIREFIKILGKVVVVEEVSIIRDGPVCVKLWCRDHSRSVGFVMRVEPEVGGTRCE